MTIVTVVKTYENGKSIQQSPVQLLIACVCVSFCTAVVHNIAQNISDNISLVLQTVRVVTAPMLYETSEYGK